MLVELIKYNDLFVASWLIYFHAFLMTHVADHDYQVSPVILSVCLSDRHQLNWRRLHFIEQYIY